MSETGAQPDRIAILEAELAQSRSHITSLQQDNDRLAAHQQRLRQSESRYRQIFENAPISMVLISTDGYITQMNAAAEDFFGLPIDLLNQQGCPIFENIQLIENGTLPYMLQAFEGEAVTEVPNFYDTARDRQGGKFAYGQGHYAPIRNSDGAVEEIVEIASDVTTFFALQEKLIQEKDRAAQERAKLLTTIAQVANLLLRSPDYTAVLPDVVRLLGEAVGCDRCSIIQELADSNLIYIPFEWAGSGITTSVDLSPEMPSLLTWDNFASFHKQYARGEIANFLVAEIAEPARSILAAQGCTSLLVVPIMVQGRCWGEIGFDNCGEPRLYDEAEIAILKIAADSIAAAIERQAKDEKLLQAEQERSQELEHLNTELQQTLDRLTESEERYRTLFEISSEGIYRFEFDQPISIHSSVNQQIELIYRHFRISEANTMWATMYGKDDPEDLVGLRLTDIHIAESEQNQAFVKAYIESGYQAHSVESHEIDFDGKPRYFLNNITTIINDSCAIGGWASQLDITELRLAQQALLQAEQERSQELEHLNTELQQTLDRLFESECRFRELFENTNDGIYFATFDEPFSIDLPIEEQIKLTYERFRLVEVNSALARMYSQRDPTEMNGRRLREFHAFESGNQQLQRAIIENGYQTRNFESEDFDENGEKRYWLSTVFGTIENNQAVRAWGIISNITELRKAKENLLKAEQERVAELVKTNQALKNSLDRLAADPDLDSFLGYVLLEINQQLNLDVATLRLYDPATQTLPIELEITQGQLQSKQQVEAPEVYICPSTTSTPVWAILLATREPFVVDRHNGKEFVFQDTYDHQADQIGLQVAVNLLLTLGDEPIGLLGLGSTQRTAFTPQELELAQALTHQATLAIQLTRLAETAKQAALLQERNYIAQDIHDTLAQTFGGILIQLQATQYFLKRNPDRAVEQFNVAIDLARQGLSEARRSVWTLYDRGADYQALEIALPQLIERLTVDSSAAAIVTITGTPYRLDPDIGQNLLRLAQEAINNALRHAHARSIKIALHYDPEQLRLRICDDGCGFDVNQPVHGFGITSMKQRADYLGSILNLTSQFGAGTEIEITVSTSVLDSPPSHLAEYLPPPGTSKLQ